MKRLVLMIVPALICGMVLTSCSSDMENLTDDNFVIMEAARIKAANVEIDGKDIVTVKATISNRLCFENDECIIVYEVATSKFKNGGFDLIFSANVPDVYLEPIVVDEGFIASDIKAKIGYVYFNAFDSAENRMGNFEIMSGSFWSASYVYADRSFTMKGQTSYGLEVDYSFNKGWNMIYYSYRGAHYYTTQKPLNVDFKCFFPIPNRCGS